MSVWEVRGRKRRESRMLMARWDFEVISSLVDALRMCLGWTMIRWRTGSLFSGAFLSHANNIWPVRGFHKTQREPQS